MMTRKSPIRNMGTALFGMDASCFFHPATVVGRIHIGCAAQVKKWTDQDGADLRADHRLKRAHPIDVLVGIVAKHPHARACVEPPPNGMEHENDL